MRFQNNAGFTLLETMIAVAIMLVAFSSILMVESSSVNTSAKSKQMNMVSMLAKNIMVESEYLVEGKSFDEIKKEETGQFKEPYQDYSWKREIKEVEFPDFGTGNQKKSGDSESEGGANEQLTKLVTQYLSKSIREIVVTVYWKRGAGKANYVVSTYWVDLNHEFQLSE